MAKQKNIPETVGTAKSLFFAEAEQPFATVERSGKEIAIVYLLLCKITGKEEYYVYGCDVNFEVHTDYYFDTLEDALEDAVQIYKLEKISWRPLIPGIKNESVKFTND